MGKKQKIVLPPELPPEVPEDEIEISDEDLDFVSQNRDYAGFVSSLDTQSINKHVTRVADMKEDALETLYERRLKKKLVEKEIKQQSLEVDPVDALPFKTLDGRLYYRTGAPEMDKVGDDKYKTTDESITKLTKADKRAKLKKSRKEAKKQKKEQGKKDEIHQTPQAAVLDEVKKDLTAEEVFGSKKRKLAELGMALLADPESNIKFLKEMLQMSKDDDLAIAKLGMLSLLAVFRDVIPGYRIRLPTEKELEMKVSKAVKKMRYYESTLLSSYKAYLQRLIALEKQPTFHHLAVQCLCTLLDAVPHFNFRDSLLAAVTKNISSPDDVVRKLCCNTIASLFSNESKHGGQATVEAVRLIANHVKLNDCQLHPDSIEVFMNLSFDEDLGKHETLDGDDKLKNKKNRKRSHEQLNELQGNERKKTRQQLIAKTREEVNADYKAASFVPDKMEKRKMQSETLSSLFQTYFRILKHSLQTNIIRSETKADKSFSAFGTRPLLDSCLNGLGKFSQLIDLDFIGDLMNYLKRLATSGSCSQGTISGSSSLTVSERLRCCIVAFKVMKSNLDALKVDLQDFFVQLYNLILEYRPGRDQGEVLAEALKIMLCEDRQHDMQKAAAFIKRLATFSLCFGSPESMAALVTLKHLLQKNVKCRNLLENDAGGGSVAGSMAKYQPFASDPNQSGALASVLWELNLLSKHYHPAVSAMASSIGNMNTAPNKAHLSTMSPQQAYKELFLEWESSKPKGDIRKLNCKRRRGGDSSAAATVMKMTSEEVGPGEDEVRKELMKHFVTLHDFKENERLRGELDRTTLFLELYEEYKKRKKSKSEGLKAL